MTLADRGAERLTRRAFVQTTAAAAAAAVVKPRSALATLGSAGRRSQWPGYDEAIVIDFLGSPGYFNAPVDPPLDDEMLGNALASGITAMNNTVSSGEFESTVGKIARWEATIARHPDVLREVRSLQDVVTAKRDGRLGIVFGFQDTVPFGRDLDRIQVFHDLGVRVVQLTYNVRNLVGDGCLEPGNSGLSRFGHQVVERLDELGILVDLSHCGQRTTAEGIQAASGPVAITHSGCSAVAPHPRSKRDEELRALADRGGVVGIYLMPFLSPGRIPTGDDVITHIEHAIQVCGEDHVGIGSDLSITPVPETEEYWSLHREFVSTRKRSGIAAPAEEEDVLFTVPDLNTPRRMELIAERLAARGHSHGRIEKVLGQNWVRLLREVWGS